MPELLSTLVPGGQFVMVAIPDEQVGIPSTSTLCFKILSDRSINSSLIRPHREGNLVRRKLAVGGLLIFSPPPSLTFVVN